MARKYQLMGSQSVSAADKAWAFWQSKFNYDKSNLHFLLEKCPFQYTHLSLVRSCLISLVLSH